MRLQSPPPSPHRCIHKFVTHSVMHNALRTHNTANANEIDSSGWRSLSSTTLYVYRCISGIVQRTGSGRWLSCVCRDEGRWLLIDHGKMVMARSTYNIHFEQKSFSYGFFCRNTRNLQQPSISHTLPPCVCTAFHVIYQIISHVAPNPTHALCASIFPNFLFFTFYLFYFVFFYCTLL